MLKPVLSALLLSFVSVCAPAQNNLPSLPSAPAPSAPSKPDFSMPATIPHTALPPSAESPAQEQKDVFCTAPSESGRLLTKEHLTPFQKDELKDFRSAFVQRLYAEWVRHMPRAVNDPWIQGKSVLLRFEILPNGGIRNAVIMMASGRHDYDDHVLRALIAAQPYPLPDGFTAPLRSCFLFQYNPRPGDPSPTDPFAPKPHKSTH